MRYIGVLDKRDAAALLTARTLAEPQRVHPCTERAPNARKTPATERD